MIRNLQAAEERGLQVDAANIEDAKKDKIEKAKQIAERNSSRVENRIRFLAVAIPPIPAVLLGLIVLGMRLANERREITPDRLVRRG